MIIGNGMVGQRFCDRLVERGGAARYDIVVIAEEAIPAYDRVHLSDIWRGRDPSELLLRSRDWYDEHRIDLRLRERVCSVDRQMRLVVTDTGASYSYDKLVFATGSRAQIPTIPLDEGAIVLSYRTLGDAQRILEEVRRGCGSRQRVAIIGGGLLGIEAARTLQQLGCDVVILEGASQLMPRQLDMAAAEELCRALNAADIDVRVEARITRVARTEQGTRLEFAASPALEADVVVAAAGARASDEIARSAGLRCHVRGGIEVNAGLHTSDPHVFAIGECASHARVPHGLVAPGYAMAEVLADRLLGKRRTLDAQHSVTRLKLDLTEVTVLGNPLASGQGEEVLWQGPGQYRRLVIARKRIVAAACIGHWEELSRVQQWVVGGRKIERSRIERFAREGTLALEGEQTDVTAWSDAAVVCQCANVTCGVLRKRIAEGCATPLALAQATSASTLCGSCRPLLATLCGQVGAPIPKERTRGLLVAGVVALLFGLSTLAVPRIPVAGSIRARGIDVLWIEPVWKQMTGYGVLAIVAVGLLPSLRKRVKGFRIGAYSLWRLAHALVGVLALGALLSHTGLRIGFNFNLALMLVFSANALTGATAGILFAQSQAASSSARMQRAGSLARTIHTIVFWPLPVLILFHVLKTYYY